MRAVKLLVAASVLSDKALAELLDVAEAMHRGARPEGKQWRGLMRGWTFTEEEPYQLRFID